MAATRFFVDKTLLIDEILEGLTCDRQKYVCITRPRRFGKTVMADMIAAFMGKAADSSLLFDRLAVSQTAGYAQHRNSFHVI